jgi:hypothetical protein
MAIEKELLDQLLAGRDPNEVFAKYWLSELISHARSLAPFSRQPAAQRRAGR